MLSDPQTKTADGLYAVKKFIIESSKDLQNVNQYLPPTDELPVTHEHYVRHYVEDRNGKPLKIVEVSVRPKASAPTVASDGLDRLDEPNLEDAAAKAGVEMTEYKKLKSKAKRIEMIREARLQPA